MVGTTLGNYRILEKLGEGGQGAVYKGVDAKLGRPVAIKVLARELTLNPKKLKRFQREARLASALDHPNICVIYDLNEIEGHHYIAMQYVEGRNLKALVNGRPLNLESALSIAIQTTDALAAAHALSIIHRDIKALNVMVTGSGQVKILDFGLAKLFEDYDDDVVSDGIHHTDLTEFGVAYGTPAYSAPEQSRGERVDPRADIFSTGVLLFEMLTGAKPFRGKDANAIRYAVMHDLPRPLAELRPEPVPPQLQEILDRTLAKDPRDRYQKVTDLRDELRQLSRQIHGEPELEIPKTAPRRWEANPVEIPNTPPRRQDANPFSRALRWLRGIPSEESKVPMRRAPAAATDEPRFTTVTDGEKKSLAILPFRNIGNDQKSSFYEFSLADALITELARVRSLVVRPSSVIARYQGRQIDPMDAGRELGVSTVLSAGFVRVRDRFRVTAQLLDVSGGQILWSDRIDAAAEDIIALQDTITQKICDGLRLELSPDEQAGLQGVATSDADAYEMYLRGRDSLGRYLYHTGARNDIDEAINYFKNATALDPSFSLAYSGLGAAYANRVMKGLGEKSDYAQAEAALSKALLLDPHSIESRVTMVFIHLSHGEKKSASTLANELRREAPNDVSVQFAKSVLARLDGNYDQSMRYLDRLVRLDPTSRVIASYHRARLLIYQGKYEEAIAELDAAVEPDHPLVRTFRAYAFHYQGSTFEALTILEQLFAQHPQLAGVRPIYAMSLFAAGRHADADNQLTQEVKDLADSDFDISYWLASAYARGLKREDAFYWLERSIKLGNEDKAWFRNDSNWTSIRDDPRFTQLINSISNPEIN